MSGSSGILAFGASAETVPTTQSELLTLVRRRLADSSYSLRFPPALEARFCSDVQADDLRTLQIFGTVGAVTYALFFFTDWQMLPDIRGLALAVRGIFLVTALSTIAIIARPQITPLVRDIATALVLVGGMSGIMLLYRSTKSMDQGCFINGAFLMMAFGSVCLPMRFTLTAATTLLSALIMLVCVMTSGMSLPSRCSDCAVASSLAVLMLLTNYRIQFQRRRAYLLTLRESLYHAEMADNNLKLKTLSEHDGLTNLWNRRAIDARLSEAITECSLANKLLGLLMLDIDNFKGFNDRYGHQTGDDCLRRVADILTNQLRTSTDSFGRFGGEEFLVILPNQDVTSCCMVAERLRAAVEQAQIPHDGGVTEKKMVTVSIGVACAVPEMPQSAEILLRQADERLYCAKRSGRNCVVSSEMGSAAIASAA